MCAAFQRDKRTRAVFQVQRRSTSWEIWIWRSSKPPPVPATALTLPVRKHRGEPGHTRDRRRRIPVNTGGARTPTGFPTGSLQVSHPEHTHDTETRSRTSRTGPTLTSQYSESDADHANFGMAKPRGPMDRTPRRPVRGDIQRRYDNSRLAGMLAGQRACVVCAAYGCGFASAQLV